MVTGQDMYPLPDGTLYSGAPAFYKGLGVDYNVNGNVNNPELFFTIWPFNMGQRNRGSIVPRLANINRPVDIKYRFQGNSLWITPSPLGGSVARIWYAPPLTPLVAQSDQVVGLMPGWEELIEIYAAIMCKIKAEEDASDLKQTYAQALKDLEDAAQIRDLGGPFTIVDVYDGGSSLGDGFGDDGWGYGGAGY